MSSQNPNHQIAIDLISQYGDDAESIAMLRAAEYAANLNTEEWLIWEERHQRDTKSIALTQSFNRLLFKKSKRAWLTRSNWS